MVKMLAVPCRGFDHSTVLMYTGTSAVCQSLAWAMSGTQPSALVSSSEARDRNTKRSRLSL
jgi:hypothetical protein